jgi:hypothetical protein
MDRVSNPKGGAASGPQESRQVPVGLRVLRVLCGGFSESFRIRSNGHPWDRVGRGRPRKEVLGESLVERGGRCSVSYVARPPRVFLRDWGLGIRDWKEPQRTRRAQRDASIPRAYDLDARYGQYP